ncbi:AzlD domain-containing protein [Pigmentiphaga litoralis]|uniref:AzlD domain-containing protein n=1 Tax=Pigmentiphaga litoralis TaxID=516702 RepID=UPI003B43AB56
MSDNLYVWLAILALGLCTLVTRASFMLLGDRVPLPDGVRRALRYAPAAALVAIIVPELLPWSPVTGPTFDLRIVAAAAAVGVMAVSRSTVAMIAAGMVTLWVLRAVTG